MFTGIVTDIGQILDVEDRAGNDLSLTIGTGKSLDDVEIGASIACSGVCLTVVRADSHSFTVDVSGETLARTAPRWAKGARLNLERALKVGDELGGHIVTGHVDGVARVLSVEQAQGSLRLTLLVPAELAPFVAGKGSLTVDGVSLTVNDVADTPDGTTVGLNIIPHTASVTTVGVIKAGDVVNVEIDVLARYLRRLNDYHTGM